MKRHGDLWNRIIAKENLMFAYTKARKHKAWQRKVKKVDKNPQKYIDALNAMLLDGTYKTSKYKTRTIYEPKKRLIYILPFYPDRILHHAIMNVLEPIWDKLFIHNSYACRKNKGQHKGSLCCMEYTKIYKYCLKCDISKFYPSINHKILKKLIRRKIKCKQTLKLLDEIIDSVDTPTNVPIGNYLSQWFGNLYLNELDQFLRHKYGVKAYLRYCDDFLIFSNSKEELHMLAKVIEEFLEKELQLKLSKCNVFPTTHGIDFLGYRHFPKGYILLRKSSTKRMKKKVNKLKYELATNTVDIDKSISMVGSLSGWIKWANTYHLKQRLCLDELHALLLERRKARDAQIL